VRPSLIVEARARPPEPGLALGPTIGVGYTASKKVGGAVVRNRSKRRLREAARRLLPLHGVAGVDYVLVARPATAEAAWAGLLDDLQNALIRLRADLAAAPRRRPPGKRPPAPTQTSTESD
jgi:ribonuclease P protein component